jgi:hypothetical protein
MYRLRAIYTGNSISMMRSFSLVTELYEFSHYTFRVSAFMVLFCCFILFFSFCSTKEGSYKLTLIDFEDTYTLTKIGQRHFQLDSVTSQESTYIQLLEISEALNQESSVFFCMLNRFENAIQIFEYNSGMLLFKISLQKEGVNGIGALDGFTIVNFDSIFVHNYYANKVFLVNREGCIKNSYAIIPEDKTHIPMPTSTSRPIIFSNNKLYFNTFGTSDPWKVKSKTLDQIVLSLDLEKKSSQYFLSYPKIYQRGVWGTVFHFLYSSYDPHKNTFTYSFPLDDNICITNHDDYLAEFYAGSKFDVGAKEPLFKERMTSQPTFEERTRYNLTMLSYKNVYFDPYSGFTFRIALLPINEDDYHSGDPIKSRIQKTSIIILDQDKRKVGEIQLPPYLYLTDMVFFTKEGVHIARKDENEDILTFDVFNVKKK